MNERLFQHLMAIKERAVEEERKDPENEALIAVHRIALKAAYKLRGAFNLTDDQFARLVADPGSETEGGGTDKPEPE